MGNLHGTVTKDLGSGICAIYMKQSQRILDLVFKIYISQPSHTFFLACFHDLSIKNRRQHIPQPGGALILTRRGGTQQGGSTCRES